MADVRVGPDLIHARICEAATKGCGMLHAACWPLFPVSYPVGIVVLLTIPDNPLSTLGYGEWAPVDAPQLPVGPGIWAWTRIA